MVNFYRLIVSAFLLLFTAQSAIAALPTRFGPNEPAIAAFYSSGVAACVANGRAGCKAGFRGEGPTSYKGYSAPVNTTLVFVEFSNDANWGSSTIAYLTSCPSNSSASGAACVCNSGFKEIAGSCQATNTDRDNCWNLSVTGNLPGGDLTQTYRYKGSVPDQKNFCVPVDGMSSGKGCTVTFNRQIMYNYGPGAEISEGTLSMSPNANLVDQSCALDPQKDKPPQEKCKNGFTGTVNGVEVCINKKPDSGVDGDKTDKQEETPEQKKTTKTDRNTDCKNGVCTTVTTTTVTTVTKPGGVTNTTTNSTTTTQNQDGFCKENPTSKLCSDGPESSFGGSCKGGFTCEGDAIQCAIAQDQHARACTFFDNHDTPEEKLYNEVKTKTGKQTGDLPGNKDIDIASRINSADIFLGGVQACPSDQVVEIYGGYSFAIPYSKICPTLSILGNVLVVIASISAVFIVIRRGS